MDSSIWLKAYTTYQKDPQVLEAWVKQLERDPLKALEVARGFTRAEAVPDTVTLGFSPQILVATLALNLRNPVRVITSPEVREGTHPAARFSHAVLDIYIKQGLIEKVLITPMTPSKGVTPKQVLTSITNTLRTAGPKILDISGGTQLVALAAATLSVGLTYTYPHGTHVVVYKVR